MSKPFAMNYKRNPAGPGSPFEWRAAFKNRMGMDAARAAVGKETPETILGVSVGEKDWNVIRKAYRALAMAHHPDRGGDAAMFRKIQGAFEILEERFGKG